MEKRRILAVDEFIYVTVHFDSLSLLLLLSQSHFFKQKCFSFERIFLARDAAVAWKDILSI